MIQFRPERPRVLLGDMYPSEATTKAVDEGYKHYCECFYNNLGDYESVWAAKDAAKTQGIYYALLTMQSRESMKEWEAGLRGDV